MRIVAQPIPANPSLPVSTIPPAEPIPTVATTTATTQTPMTKSAATSIPVTVYNLAQGKFQRIPNLTTKVQEGEGPSASSYNNTQEEQPEATAAVIPLQNTDDTSWLNTMPASINLIDARASWPIVLTESPTVVAME